MRFKVSGNFQNSMRVLFNWISRISWKCLATILFLLLFSCKAADKSMPEHFRRVSQVIWVVDDLDKVIHGWAELGFSSVADMDTLNATPSSTGDPFQVRMAMANLGGANITWIQPLEEGSVFARFHSDYGDGAMALVHHLEDEDALEREMNRLGELGVSLLERISIPADEGTVEYVLMNTLPGGKYVLGYTWGDADDVFFRDLDPDNLHHLKLNQYAFAIREAEPVSEFWEKLGQPAFAINYPELGNMHYYGEPTDHELIQGWQKHGTIAYEWCIPVKNPIVYDDHIRKHGEGIHHLAFSVKDMDAALADYASKGYRNSMGGTWGETGKPGSGRYEYIDLDDAGGVTMELLWNYQEGT